MTLIAKAAYFIFCAKCPVLHGTIVCVDDTKVACFSKQSARACVEELAKRNFITEIEKPGLLDQIYLSRLSELSLYPAQFYPSETKHDAEFKPSGTRVFNNAISPQLAQELDGMPSGQTRH